MLFACDAGPVKRAGGTPALRNRSVAIDIVLGLLEICFSGALNQGQKRRPRSAVRKTVLSYLSYLSNEKTFVPGSLARPFRKFSSTAKAAPAISPPSWRIKLTCGCGCASGGEEIVAEEDVLAGLDGVGVDFERIGGVFELVGDGYCFRGQFFRFANGDESGVETVGESRGENEAARFDSGDDVYFVAVVVLAEAVDERVETARVLQQSGEVVEKNAGLGVVGNFADQFFEIEHRVFEVVH